MKRTLFHMGLPSNGGPWNGPVGAGIPVYKAGRDNIDRDEILNRKSTPPGYSVPYPYMVKVIGEGEYWIKADGTTQFYSYKYGRWDEAEANNGNFLLEEKSFFE